MDDLNLTWPHISKTISRRDLLFKPVSLLAITTLYTHWHQNLRDEGWHFWLVCHGIARLSMGQGPTWYPPRIIVNVRDNQILHEIQVKIYHSINNEYIVWIILDTVRFKLIYERTALANILELWFLFSWVQIYDK